jgi:3-isopropylmalate/(R)-2-methylmalate dehydratase small subunit
LKIKGKAWKFGDDVDTDAIIPAKHLSLTDPKELGAHCMEGIEPGFASKVNPGDILVAGKNFGCGSSREHAPLALKGCGISMVIAESFARIFYRNGFNLAMPLLESPDAAADINTGDELEADLDKGMIRNLTRKKEYRANPVPEFMQRLIRDGGLMPSVIRGLKEKT